MFSLVRREGLVKWGLVGGAVAVGGIWIVPWLIQVTLNLLTLALLGIVGLALCFTLPAVCEAFSLLGWRLWDLAIRRDPVSRLRGDLEAHARQIQQLEERIASADAEMGRLEKLLRDSKRALTDEDTAEWTGHLQTLRLAGRELVEIRDEEIRRHQEFDREIQRAETEHRLGQAFKAALGALNFAKRSGPEALGARVALDEVERQLGASQSRLALALSRPKAVTGHEPKRLTAKEGAA